MTAECRHEWVIETANGPTSPGVCKKCGEEAIFPNSFPFNRQPWAAPTVVEHTVFPHSKRERNETDA